MAKVKVNILGAQRAVERLFKSAIKDKELLNDIGESAVKNSVASVRLGKDPATGKPIAGFANRKTYPEARSRIASRRGAGTSFKPKKSNLTLTGQLLRSIKHKIKGNIITIQAEGNHSPYYSGGKRISNAQLAEWHSSGAGNLPVRNVIGVSAKVREIINAKVRAFIRRSISRTRR